MAKITGTISNTETQYDRTYLNDDITISSDFLKFEHTNGLNYINLDVRRFDEILNLNKIKINLTEGIGAGILLPKTNTTLFYKNNNDQYHLSGYGISTVMAVNISFFKFFFIQSELKTDISLCPILELHQTMKPMVVKAFFLRNLILSWELISDCILLLNRPGKT